MKYIILIVLVVTMLVPSNVQAYSDKEIMGLIAALELRIAALQLQLDALIQKESEQEKAAVVKEDEELEQPINVVEDNFTCVYRNGRIIRCGG